MKVLGRDSYDRIPPVVQTDGCADRASAGAEFIRPHGVTDHHHGLRVEDPVFLGKESAPENRFYAQHIEVVPGDKLAGGIFGLTFRCEGDRNVSI